MHDWVLNVAKSGNIALGGSSSSTTTYLLLDRTGRPVHGGITYSLLRRHWCLVELGREMLSGGIEIYSNPALQQQ